MLNLVARFDGDFSLHKGRIGDASNRRNLGEPDERPSAQIAPSHGCLSRQRVIGSAHQMRDIRADLCERQIVVWSRFENDCSVDGSLDDHGQSALVLDVVQRDIESGMFAPKDLDNRRQNCAGDRWQRRDADPAMPVVAARCKPLKRALEVAHDLARHGGGMTAFGC